MSQYSPQRGMSAREREEARKERAKTERLMGAGAIVLLLLAGIMLYFWYQSQQGHAVGPVIHINNGKSAWLDQQKAGGGGGPTPGPAAAQ